MSLNVIEVHEMTVGDTKQALRFKLQRGGVARSIVAGDTVKFVLTKASDDSAKVAETALNITVNDTAAGDVQYNWQAADVNTLGEYWAYFVVIDSAGKRDTFPADGKKRKVIMYAKPGA